MFISKKDREYIEGKIRDINIGMWSTTLWEKRINAQIEKLEQEIKNLQSKILSTPDLVECETCGCAIKKETAIRGQSIIKIGEVSYFLALPAIDEEYIHTPYYCKRCAPEDKKPQN